jgi:hypothetical protein
MATLTGARAVNDPAATNVAQNRAARDSAAQARRAHCRFGRAYKDDEIAALANYVTARFGSKRAELTMADVARPRNAVAN